MLRDCGRDGRVWCYRPTVSCVYNGSCGRIHGVEVRQDGVLQWSVALILIGRRKLSATASRCSLKKDLYKLAYAGKLRL